jgi:Protein of unknown function (DUF2946)
VRPRAAAGLLLLVLTAHAFVAGATHFHRRVVSGAHASRVALHGGDADGQSVPPAGDEAQCLLCRLQRNFVSDLQSTTLAFAPPAADALRYAAPRKVSARAVRFLAPSGRAPPSV